METRGRELQQWGNCINDVVLSQIHQDHDGAVFANDPGEFSIDLIPNTYFPEWASLVVVYDASRFVETSIPDWMNKYIEFTTLAYEWRVGRPRSSRMGEIVGHPAYQRIIGMGPIAIRWILMQLRLELQFGEPDHWFWALWAISGESPVSAADQGKIRKMAEAWLAWGKQRGFLDA